MKLYDSKQEWKRCAACQTMIIDYKHIQYECQTLQPSLTEQDYLNILHFRNNELIKDTREYISLVKSIIKVIRRFANIWTIEKDNSEREREREARINPVQDNRQIWISW